VLCCHCCNSTSTLYRALAADDQNLKRLPHDLIQTFQPFEEILGYTFKDKGLLIQAFTHPSTITFAVARMGDYQRLEFLGDALLDIMVVITLYQRHSDWEPYQLVEAKEYQVCNETLARWGSECLQIHRFIRHDCLALADALKTFVRDRRTSQAGKEGVQLGDGYPKAIADVLEAVIAAVYLDSADMGTLMRVFEPLVFCDNVGGGQEKDVDDVNGENVCDSKDEDDDKILVKLRSMFPSLSRVLELLHRNEVVV